MDLLKHTYIRNIINCILITTICSLLYIRDWSSKHKYIKGNILFMDLQKIYSEQYKPSFKYLYVKRDWNGLLKIGYHERKIIAEYKEHLVDDEGNIVPYFPHNNSIFKLSGFITRDDISTLKDLIILSKKINITSASYKNGLWKIYANGILIKVYNPLIILKVYLYSWFNKSVISEIDLRYENINNKVFIIKLQDNKWKSYLQYKHNALS